MIYKLPKHIELIKYSNPPFQVEYSVLVKKRKVKAYVINEFIYDFMNYFNTQTTLDAVINDYYDKVNTNEEQKEVIKLQLETFFKDLKKKGWIVDKDFVEDEFHYKTAYQSNAVLGDFKIESIIANNQLTDVYLANTLKTNKKVVIKYLNKNKFKDLERYKRYIQYTKDEFEFLKQFNSTHINKAFNYYHKDDECFFTLRFVNGISLFRYVRQHHLKASEKLKLVHKILKGFALIHSEGVYHGDIHSGNIMVTKTSHIKIIDFGYSNPVVPRENLNDLKIRNGGSHAFIPPERALRSIDRKFNAVEQFQSEVYQIGLLVYYVYIKDLPFVATTWKTMVDEKKAFNIHTFQPFIKKRLPAKVRHFIIKSLERNPEDRFQSAESMFEAWT